MCRFYLLLAGAVGKRQGIAIPYPSPTPLLTPLGDPLRRGNVGCRGGQGYRQLVSGAVANPHFDVMFGGIVFGLGLFAFQKISLGIGSFVFHWWWDGLYVPAATWCFAFSFVELPLTAPFSPISLDASPFHQCCRVQKYRKNAFVRLKLQETGFPLQAPPI